MFYSFISQSYSCFQNVVFLYTKSHQGESFQLWMVECIYYYEVWQGNLWRIVRHQLSVVYIPWIYPIYYSSVTQKNRATVVFIGTTFKLALYTPLTDNNLPGIEDRGTKNKHYDSHDSFYNHITTYIRHIINE